MGFLLQAEDYEQLTVDLDEFLVNSEALSAMLCDQGGNIIIHAGDSQTESIDLVSALVAGAFAATKELAVVLGEKEFTAIFHQGTKTSIFISAVGEEVLLLAMFSDETNAGLVKMYALNACRKIRGLFDDVMSRDEINIDDMTKSFVVSRGPLF
jgi:predicted regulator of Ras-like GTPase activity (Roadblock/LC7/MglB family)